MYTIERCLLRAADGESLAGLVEIRTTILETEKKRAMSAAILFVQRVSVVPALTAHSALKRVPLASMTMETLREFSWGHL